MRKTFKIFFLAMMTGSFIFSPVYAYADGHDHDRDGHDHHEHRDHNFIGLNFNVWPDSYYYSAPYYPPADAVLVSPPVYQQVVVNGMTYYMYNGSYYIYNGYGYQAVVPPVTVVQPPVPVVQTPVVTDMDTSDSFTINIPNSKGGYTAVTLKKSGSGYIGPQGEFYSEFPKVSQLVVIYGK